jgi:hypothetical protein
VRLLAGQRVSQPAQRHLVTRVSGDRFPQKLQGLHPFPHPLLGLRDAHQRFGAARVPGQRFVIGRLSLVQPLVFGRDQPQIRARRRVFRLDRESPAELRFGLAQGFSGVVVLRKQLFPKPEVLECFAPLRRKRPRRRGGHQSTT